MPVIVRDVRAMIGSSLVVHKWEVGRGGGNILSIGCKECTVTIVTKGKLPHLNHTLISLSFLFHIFPYPPTSPFLDLQRKCLVVMTMILYNGMPTYTSDYIEFGLGMVVAP